MPCSKGMRGCATDCAHRRFVRDYVAERERQVVAAEAQTHGYATEEREYFEEHDRVTFKSWLRQHTGRDYPYPRCDREDELLEATA